MVLYHLVQFNEKDQDESVEIVPESWIEKKVNGSDNWIIAFPPKTEYQSIRALIREASTPKSTWQSYEGCILYSNGEFNIYLI